MKKFGILLVLAMLAIGVSAQDLSKKHHPEPKGNTANLEQYGFSQWGFIFQFGKDNTATIEQGDKCGFSFMNTAYITQIGENNDGTITQTGHLNYASLTQMNFGWHHGQYYASFDWGAQKTIGTINQSGSHNVASVLQLKGSELLINQSGSHNFIGGSCGFGNCCAWLDAPSYYQSCCPTFYTPLVVGPGETLKLNQTGQGEFFFGVGILKGDRSISQGNSWGYGNYGKGNHMKLDYNAIWLEQDGGNAILSQNGRYNRILLDLDVVKHHRYANDPYVKIEQNGIGNVVAKFNGPCTYCTDDPAEFNGDKMTVEQNGMFNRLSIDSDGAYNSITVTQTGMYNFGMIVQKGMGYNQQNPTNCVGCQH